MDSKCKLCRRAGEKLFLKGDKCFSPSCTFNKRPYAPGRLDSERKHKSVLSEYGMQLKEKQKVRNIYGMSEHQFSSYVKYFMNKKGVNPSEKIYERLEMRLDNIVYRLGLASSRALARQMVTHGHISVNGKRNSVPSHIVSVGDQISVREESKPLGFFKNFAERIKNYHLPSWLMFDESKMTGQIKSSPKDEDRMFNLNTVLEYYSG